LVVAGQIARGAIRSEAAFASSCSSFLLPARLPAVPVNRVLVSIVVAATVVFGVAVWHGGPAAPKLRPGRDGSVSTLPPTIQPNRIVVSPASTASSARQLPAATPAATPTAAPASPAAPATARPIVAASADVRVALDCAALQVTQQLSACGLLNLPEGHLIDVSTSVDLGVAVKLVVRVDLASCADVEWRGVDGLASCAPNLTLVDPDPSTAVSPALCASSGTGQTSIPALALRDGSMVCLVDPERIVLMQVVGQPTPDVIELRVVAWATQ
jgi:hypothetical protein